MTVTISGSTGISGVDGSAGTPAVQGADTNTGMFFPAVDTVAIGTGGIEVLRVNSSQNVGIGTSSPSEKLSVHSAIGVRGSNFASTSYFGSSVNATGVYTGLDSAGGFATNVRDSGYLVYSTNNTERMRIDSAGALILAGSTAQKATGTTWSNPSDQRLKNNIRDYTKGIAELMQVRVREWEYNGKGGTVDGTKGLGVIADEVMTVLPDTVDNYTAKLNCDDAESTSIKKFDATEITWLLVKSIQELKAQNDELKARVAALEAK